MRRLWVIVSCLALCVAAAAYSAYWFMTAARLRSGLERWAASRQTEGRDLHWTAVSAEGFPLSFRLRASGVALHGARPLPFDAASPAVIGEARPWNLRLWHLTAPQGAELQAPIEGASVAAATLDGTLALDPTDGTAVTLIAHEVAASGRARLYIAEAELQLNLPDHAPESHRDTALGVGLRLAQVMLPVGLPPLGDTVDALRLAGTVKGVLPPGPLRPALDAWREDGGTIELQDGQVHWGALALAASGTLALDAALQPIGALTAIIEDQDAVIDAAVVQGQMRASDAGLAKAFLGLMAKPGPDGKPQLTIPMSLQSQRLYLGPAQIAKLPPITWE